MGQVGTGWSTWDSRDRDTGVFILGGTGQDGTWTEESSY